MMGFLAGMLVALALVIVGAIIGILLVLSSDSHPPEGGDPRTEPDSLVPDDSFDWVGSE